MCEEEGGSGEHQGENQGSKVEMVWAHEKKRGHLCWQEGIGYGGEWKVSKEETKNQVL